jgi:FkbM family methyltransferase
LLNVFRKIVTFTLFRLPIGSPVRRDLTTAVLWQLPEVTYFRLRDHGFQPNGIVDVGAHVGDWSRLIRKVFPAPPIVMIEARPSQQPALQKACAELHDAAHVIALLGSQSRDDVDFYVQDTGSSLFGERSNVPRSSAKLPMRTMDEVVGGDARLKPPLFLKLDVQGAELEVLRGAPTAMSLAEVIQVEVQLLPYNEGAPPAAEVIAFMDQHGFAIFDVAGFVRPNQTDLVQLDLVFVRKSSAMRRDFFRYESR